MIDRPTKMRVTRVLAHNPGPYTGAGNNTYLVGGPDAMLIDAGSGMERHLDELAAALGDHGARLSSVLVTHGHPDHASGVEAIAGRWPEARFFKMPWPDADGRYRVAWNALSDGDRLPGGAGTSPGGTSPLEAVHTPGHAPDHVAFWDPRERTLFAGDLVMLEGTVVIPASRGGSLTQYLRSLERVLALRPARILPGHGPAIEDPAALIAEYLRHRQRREDQILAAVRSGLVTLESIADSVYDGLPPALVGAARETVLAHLVKLQEDGVVSRDADRWCLVAREGGPVTD